MNQLIKKSKLTIIVFCIFCLVFPSNIVLAYPNEDKPNPSTDTVEVSVGYKMEFFKNEKLTTLKGDGTPFTENDFVRDEKMGWLKCNYNGAEYVVLAGATYSMFDNENSYQWKDYIHYFKEYNTVSFRVNNEVFNGIILSEYGDAMNVEENDSQILAVYIGPSGDENSIKTLLNGDKINVSENGIFQEKVIENDYKKGIFETIVGVVEEGVSIVGDFLESVIVSAETWEIASKLTYTREEIESNAELKDKIEVSDYAIDNNSKLRNVNLKQYVTDKNGKKRVVYTKETPIPAIPVDIYSSTNNSLNILKTNFFDNSVQNTNSGWKILKDAVLFITRLTIYIASALMLTILILKAIELVISTVENNPQKIANSKKIIRNLIKTIVFLIGSFLLMNILTFLYEKIVEIIVNDGKSCYLIRLNVENVYSFNTNIIGYIKYLSLNSDVLKAAGYTVLYFFISLVDFLWFWFMAKRVIILAGLTIIAPLTAIMTLRGKNIESNSSLLNMLQFKTWIGNYVAWLFMPLIVLIMQKLIFYII